ncbi:MAG: two-component regulator propeller domain-containing protein, partial [Bacteroidota bacterium]
MYLYCFLAFQSWSQDPYHIHYDTKDGLPSSEVYDLYIDSTGLIWLTTDRGVGTYNGYEFQIFTTKEGLSDNTNFKIIPDLQGGLWFLAYSGGFSSFKNGRFQAHPQNEVIHQHQRGYWVKQLLFDDQNQLYFAYNTYRQPVTYNKIDNTQQLHFGLSIEKEYLWKEEVFKVLSLADGALVQIDDSTLSDQVVQLPDSRVVFCANDQLLQIADQKISVLYNLQGIDPEFLYCDREHNFWIGTTNGLLYFEQSDFSTAPDHFFRDLYTTSLQQDQEGNYWMSTLKAGLFYIPSFRVLNWTRGLPDSLINKNTLSLAANESYLAAGFTEGDFALIPADAGAAKLAGENKRIVDIKYIHEIDGHFYGSFGLHGDPYGDIWPFSYSNWRSKNNWSDVGFRFPGGNYFCSGQAGFVIRDTFGHTLWGSGDQSVDKITVVALDMPKGVWLGTIQGVYYVSLQEQTIEKILAQVPALEGRISDLHWADDQLWIATLANGLFCQTPDSLYHWNTAAGLNSDMISSIFFENDHTLWVGSNKGLNQVTFQKTPKQI